MKEPVIEGQWKEAIDQEYTSGGVQVIGPKRARFTMDSGALVLAILVFLF